MWFSIFSHYTCARPGEHYGYYRDTRRRHWRPASDSTAQYKLGITRQMGTSGKIAFEKYFIRKMRRGDTERYFESAVLKLMGIAKLKD